MQITIQYYKGLTRKVHAQEEINNLWSRYCTQAGTMKENLNNAAERQPSDKLCYFLLTHFTSPSNISARIPIMQKFFFLIIFSSCFYCSCRVGNNSGHENAPLASLNA